MASDLCRGYKGLAGVSLMVILILLNTYSMKEQIAETLDMNASRNMSLVQKKWFERNDHIFVPPLTHTPSPLRKDRANKYHLGHCFSVSSIF